jgi:hypothetical protein
LDLLDNSLSSRIANISFRSVRKRYTRFGIRLTSTLGLTTSSSDNEKDSPLTRQLRCLEKTVKILTRDATVFLAQIEVKNREVNSF